MFDIEADRRRDSGGKKSIDLHSILEDIARHWLSILLLTAGVFIFAFVFLSWRQQSSYASSATIAVTNTDYMSNVDTYNMLTYSADVTGKVKSILESKEFRDAAAAELGYSSFRGSETVSIVGDSNLLRITVRSGSPDVSYLEVKAILNNYKKLEDNLSGGARFTILEQPAIQARPDISASGMKKAMIAALAVCALLCFALAGISACRDDIRDGLDVTDKLGASFLGAVYRNRKFRITPDLLITDPAASQDYVEEIRRLAGRVGRKMAEKGHKVLLVTSASGAEGKSAAAANLAAVWREAGKKVIVVSAEEAGAIASAGDFVIIDAPPLSESSDAVELAGLADTSVLVVRRHYSQTPQVRSAVSALGGADRLLGVIVTDVRGYSADVSVTECERRRASGAKAARKPLVDRGQKNVIEIDLLPFLGDLSREIRRYGILLLAVTLLFGGAFYYLGGRKNTTSYTAYSTFTAEPAESVIYQINNQKNLTTALVGKMLPSMLSSDAMKAIVKEDMGYGPPDRLPAQISASVVTNTNLIKLSVSAAEPQLAYDVLQSVLRCSSIITDAAIGSVRITTVNESGVPEGKGISTGNGKKAAAAGLLLGLIVGLVVLVCKLVFRDTILTEDEIGWKLKARNLGQLPWIAAGKRVGDRITIEADDVPQKFKESVRAIRCRVEEAAQESGAKAFLVTSAVGAEGKTTAAVNLALALAGRGHRVALVDGDLRKPSAAKVLGIEPGEAGSGGLAGILTGKCTLEQALVSCRGKKEFMVLPGGEAVESPYALWNGRAAGEVFEKLRGGFDYVIVDAPQSAVLSETGLIAELADACLFLIRRDRARFDEICEGVETFEESDCRFLGCVMRS
ncbi:MAG: AAA family ATPase [Lachnospiraceae bacterium]|nr:AAA family ATPase [Lachnospiraceae bacterium]